MRRFSNLEDVYNTLLAAGFDFNTLPANNKYRKYAEWKQDPEQRELPPGSAQETGARVRAGVQPFGLAIDPDNEFDVGISGRVNTEISGLGGAALYGLEIADLTGYTRRPGFVPAKAILAARLATSRAVPGTQNRITGQPYKRRTGETYTIPFGRKTATSTEFETQDEIITDRAATHALTFTPEKLSRR